MGKWKLSWLRFVPLLGVMFSTILSGHVMAAPQEGNASLIAKTVMQLENFPSNSVLDNFNRANGSLGSNWSGMTTDYAIVVNKLVVGTTEDIYWNPSIFGLDQEAFITLDSIDPSASEVGIILKAQDNNQIGQGMITVSYYPAGNYVIVWTYIKTPESWQQHGANIPVTFANGDQFGARVKADGDVEVYRNGELLGVRDVSDWPFYSSGGYIGLANYDSSGMVLDDFGGGTIGNSPTLTPTPTTSCTDPLTCNPVVSVPARWRCNIPECTDGDWYGSVIAWPSWAAYEDNSRSGSNSRTIYTPEGVKLYPYMGSWADGCQVTAISGIVLIIEWQRGTDVWRETYLAPGQSHTIDLISPEDGVLLESPNDETIFSVLLTNCIPQDIYATPTHTVTYANGGGTGTLPTQSPVSEGASFIVASGATLSRAGFTFAGWNDGTNTYAAGSTYTMGTSNVTLTAQWTAISYTALVDVTIGGSPMESYTIPSSGRVTPIYAGINNGPVQVKSTNGVPIITSERAYRGPNYTDWNEMLGFPADQLTTEYWFPVYDTTGIAQTFLSIGNTK